jgi:hypothetical protein
MTSGRRVLLIGPLLVLAAIGCGRAGPGFPFRWSARLSAERAFTDALHARQKASRSRETNSGRDLSVDESMGGHTLSRHVGRSDADLANRLRREPQISSASTYTDRAVAERTVGAALASAAGRIDEWQHRRGRRPNLVLHYVERRQSPVGRSLARGQRAAVASNRVLVVLRWDERSDRFYVLTSYPEAGR